VEKVGNSLKEDLAKLGYKSKHESTKRSGWLEWCSHGLPTSINKGTRYRKQIGSWEGRKRILERKTIL